MEPFLDVMFVGGTPSPPLGLSPSRGERPEESVFGSRRAKPVAPSRVPRQSSSPSRPRIRPSMPITLRAARSVPAT